MQPLARFPELPNVILDSYGDWVLIKQWDHGLEAYRFYVFDASELDNPQNALYPLDNLSRISSAVLVDKTLYGVNQTDGDKLGVLVFDLSDLQNPVLIQRIPDYKNISVVNRKWAIFDYPMTPAHLYRREENGTLKFVKELQAPDYLTWFQYFPSGDPDTFFNVAYENLPVVVTLTQNGDVETHWIPLGFPPFIGHSWGGPSITKIIQQNEKLIIGTILMNIDSFPSEDFVPDKVDVPMTWDGSDGEIVVVDNFLDTSPMIIKPDVRLNEAPEFYNNEGTYSFDVYDNLIAAVQVNELRVWKNDDGDFSLIQRIISQRQFYYVAVAGYWLLASGADGLDVYDISSLPTSVLDWPLY